MLPLGHLAVAYLAFVVVAFLRRRPLPARWALLPLAFGSQFPDLVDKPLAYYDVLTYGRSLAHSMLTAILLCGLLWWGCRRLRDTWATGTWQAKLVAASPLAFTVGYWTHTLSDAWPMLSTGRYDAARWLLWPRYGLPDVPADDIAPWTRMLRIYREMGTHPDLELIVAAGLVFITIRVIAGFLGRTSHHPGR